MVHGLSSIEPLKKKCESWILTKQHREEKLVGKSYRAKHPLEMIHLDLCGPMQTPSLSRKLYFFTFIDNFSKKLWVFFVKYKSNVCAMFKEFKEKV